MTIKVGIINNPPFIYNQEKISGFTIDVWEHIAKQKKIKYKYYTIKGGIKKAIDENKYDVYLGRVNITPELISKVDFTIPYYFSNFAVVTKPKNNTSDIIALSAKLLTFLISYILISMTIYYFLQEKDIKLNEVIYYTIKNMSPYLAGKRDTDLLARFNYLFTFIFILVALINYYFVIFNTEVESDLPKKPILVDSKSRTLIKYLNSRGAQVKIVNNSGGFDKLLDLYLEDPDELSGVFITEEGKISKNGILFNNNPKYQGLRFKRYNFGRTQNNIAIKKNHPLYQSINSELIKIKENGTLYDISKKWLHYTHRKQLHI